MLKDQTDPRSISEATSTTKGLAVFAVANPSGARPRSVTKIIHPDAISYRECILRGEQAVAFKWTPNVTPTSVEGQQCPMQGHPCVDRCAHPLCLCIDGECE
jgi:hypothetical protein